MDFSAGIKIFLLSLCLMVKRIPPAIRFAVHSLRLEMRYLSKSEINSLSFQERVRVRFIAQKTHHPRPSALRFTRFAWK